MNLKYSSMLLKHCHTVDDVSFQGSKDFASGDPGSNVGGVGIFRSVLGWPGSTKGAG